MSKRVANPEKLEELDSKIGTVPSGQTVEGQISSLNSKIANVSGVVSDTANSSYGTFYWFKNNRIIVVTADLYINTSIADGTEITTLPKPAYNNHFIGILINSSGAVGRVIIDPSTGKLKASGTIQAISYARLLMTYISET